MDATSDIATLVASHYAVGAISRTEEASDNVIRAATASGDIAIKLFSTAEVDRAGDSFPSQPAASEPSTRATAKRMPGSFAQLGIAG